MWKGARNEQDTHNTTSASIFPLQIRFMSGESSKHILSQICQDLPDVLNDHDGG